MVVPDSLGGKVRERAAGVGQAWPTARMLSVSGGSLPGGHFARRHVRQSSAAECWHGVSSMRCQYVTAYSFYSFASENKTPFSCHTRTSKPFRYLVSGESP